MLHDAETGELVDAVDLEHRATTAAEVLEALGLSKEDIRQEYEWLAHRAQSTDPNARLYEVLRLEPRRIRETDRGISRQALDFYDAAEVFRRFYRDLTGDLLPDADQLDAGRNEEPRQLGREPGHLTVALRRHSLYPHRLHMIVEGETEVCLVKKLFEGFAGRPWAGAGLEITDLGGDKLESSRPMIEGFAVYADKLALLLDSENDVERITRHLKETGVVPDLDVHLCQPSLEEENFTPDELVQIAQSLARKSGHELRLTSEELVAGVESHNRGRKNRKGMASVLRDMARNPKHGAITINKPDLAGAMADFLFDDIKQAPGKHDEVAEKRPIVRWVRARPVRASRS